MQWEELADRIHQPYRSTAFAHNTLENIPLTANAGPQTTCQARACLAWWGGPSLPSPHGHLSHNLFRFEVVSPIVISVTSIGSFPLCDCKATLSNKLPFVIILFFMSLSVSVNHLRNFSFHDFSSIKYWQHVHKVSSRSKVVWLKLVVGECII